MRHRPEQGHVVRLTATDADVDDPAAMAVQLPDPGTLAAGTAVVVEATALQRRGLLRRVLGDRRVPVACAIRCTALLARGYVGIAADDDAAWGFAPSRDDAPPS